SIPFYFIQPEDGIRPKLVTGVQTCALPISIAVPDFGSREPAGRVVARLEIDKLSKDVRALGENGELIAFYPASIGSKEKPAPSRSEERRVGDEVRICGLYVM